MRIPAANSGLALGRPAGRTCRYVALAGAVVLVLCQAAMSDTIRKRNGTILRGRIVSENETQVVFEWTQFGACIVKVPRKDIVAITRGKYDPNSPAPVKPKTDP